MGSKQCLCFKEKEVVSSLHVAYGSNIAELWDNRPMQGSEVELGLWMEELLFSPLPSSSSNHPLPPASLESPSATKDEWEEDPVTCLPGADEKGASEIGVPF